jgi:RNA polymerase sigma-70 factor (ECF subfamily)
MLAAEELLEQQIEEGARDWRRPAMPPADQWAGLVERIRLGDPDGLEVLYRHFSKGVRYFLFRQLGLQELEDKVHDTFLIVVDAIIRGELREPDRLMGYIRTVVRRQVAAHIDVVTQSRRSGGLELEAEEAVPDSRADQEVSAIQEQRAEIMKDLLMGISDRDREILTRFYLDEHSVDRICRDLGLTRDQFRLLKNRAKARLCEAGRQKIFTKTCENFGA